MSVEHVHCQAASVYNHNIKKSRFTLGLHAVVIQVQGSKAINKDIMIWESLSTP